jgi:hypothetical protein
MFNTLQDGGPDRGHQRRRGAGRGDTRRADEAGGPLPQPRHEVSPLNK